MIAGAINASLTPVVNGNYAVIVNQNGCIDTSSCVSINTIAIHQINKKDLKITIFPNPTTESVYLDFSATDIRQATVQIYSMDGKMMQQQSVQGNLPQVRLPDTAGVYIVAIQSENGIQHYKVIKE